MTAETLLRTRYSGPAIRPNLVLRPRLIARLNAGLGLSHRLTLVAAPAGFGKTTLLREWLETLDRPAAWLTIDQEDNDPISFLKYSIAALQQVNKRLGQSVLPLLHSEGPVSEQTLVAAVTALINDLAAGDSELLLALDDYHLISSFAVHDMLAFLIDNLPPGFHLVIGTREDPPLPLARLRARGQITEIRERALRFTPAEASDFFNETMKLALTPEDVAALESRTEGWAAGLQLAGLALQDEPDPERAEAFIAAFAGDDRYVMDYLMAEVLQRQPEEIRHFLGQTAIVDRLTAPLCDALLAPDETRPQPPEGRSQEILEYLERANLFIIPLDNRREWYRYHGLFAEVLRSALRPGDRLRLHRRAARWYELNGYPDEAGQHALAYARAKPTATLGTRQPLVEPLSERELEVLGLMAAGLRNREIARELTITTGTVKRHTNHIYGKLGVHNRTRAVARARELGLLKSA